MGKVTGFLEFERLHEAAEQPQERLKHWREFVGHLTEKDAGTQGARCMDCGTPFCMSGCPVNNIIPDWNDLVFKQDWLRALDTLHSTNNFPEFTGRICPAPCEAACTLNINNDPVGIKSIEHAIIDKGWESGWVKPQPAAAKTGKRVAVIGSGPGRYGLRPATGDAPAMTSWSSKNLIASAACCATAFPDFKMEKHLIDRRVEQMRAEGVEFRVSQHVGGNVPAQKLLAEFDAVVVAGGAEQPRDLPVPGA